MWLLAPTLVFGAGTLLVVLVASWFRDDEAWWLVGSWFAHLFAMAVQFWLLRAVYRSGDAYGYHGQAAGLARFVQSDLPNYLPEVFRLILQMEARLPSYVLGAGEPTGSMTGITALVELATGRNFYAVAMVISLGAALGKIALYAAFRQAMPQRQHFGMLIACCYMPSVVFWSSGIVKEAVVLTFLGPLVLATLQVLRSRLQWLPIAGFSLMMIGLVKPYILLAYVSGAAVWLYWHRAIQRDGRVHIRPIWALAGLAVAAVGVVGIGQMFPQFAADQLLEAVADEQALGARFQRGSSIQMRGGDGVVGQLALAPLALVNAWFRPTLLDAYNAQMFVNALETTVITVAGARALFVLRPAEFWRRISSRPILIFGLVYALSLGVGVGLTSTNFGTLSRYRMPLVPFLTAVVVSLQVAAAPAPAPPPPAARTARRRNAEMLS